MPYVVLLILLCSMAGSYAADNDRVITVFSSTSQDDQVGPEPVVFAYLLEHLSGYQIQQVHAGVDRSLHMLSNLTEGCIRNVVKNPERELLFDYSLPETLFLGMKAYLSPRTTRLVAHEETDTIDLVEFVTRHKLVVGIDRERSYGPAIDNELAKLPKANKYIKDGAESEDRMARMLFADRIDLWLEYQTVMDLYQHEYLSDTVLSNYYVKGAPRYIHSHIACNKNANSLELISSINQVLRALYKEDLYYQAHIQFVSANLQSSFNQVFRQFIMEHSQ